MKNNLFKQLFVKDLKEGQLISNQPFAVRSYKKTLGKNNKWYADIEISDNSGSVKGKIWSDNLSDYDPKPSDIILLSGTVTTFANSQQVIITEIEKTESYDASDFIQSSKKDINKLFNQIKISISKVSDNDLRNLLQNCVLEEDFKNLIIKATAAFSVHHSYSGGLLEHICEGLDLADSLILHFPKIRKDYLVTGIILHDIGKVFEFNVETSISYTQRGKLLGHMYLGCEHIIKNTPKNFPQEKLDQVIHMILSHHGELEYGSSIKPKTLEAIALWMVDNTSSKLNMAYSHIYDNIDTEEQAFTSFHRHLETELFLEPYKED
jgi:3'-5' exoribonuclease